MRLKNDWFVRIINPFISLGNLVFPMLFLKKRLILTIFIILLIFDFSGKRPVSRNLF